MYDMREVEVKTSWTVLFYDLLFVVLCIQLGDQLKESMWVIRAVRHCGCVDT